MERFYNYFVFEVLDQAGAKTNNLLMVKGGQKFDRCAALADGEALSKDDIDTLITDLRIYPAGGSARARSLS